MFVDRMKATREYAPIDTIIQQGRSYGAYTSKCNSTWMFANWIKATREYAPIDTMSQESTVFSKRLHGKRLESV